MVSIARVGPFMLWDLQVSNEEELLHHCIWLSMRCVRIYRSTWMPFMRHRLFRGYKTSCKCALDPIGYSSIKTN